MAFSPVFSAKGVSVHPDGARIVTRTLPEEVPVAFVFDGTTQAVMMATPADIEDFAVGFALTEGIVESAGEIGEIEVVEHGPGIEARMWLAPGRGEALARRRRAMAGPVGCGLCGIDSLDQALRPLPRLAMGVSDLTAAEIAGAGEALRTRQPLHDQTRAVHAAGYLRPGAGLVAVREDVGRHNALDKLIGTMARAGAGMDAGAVVMTSRLSVELVQKCAIARCPVIVAVSAPTALALRQAEEAGVTLAAFARAGGVDIYSHANRIRTGASHVA
ncbi:formate dehydrogenase accessory sulfurtransferase FdhD [Albidovulum sp.]|uniref:formate dehydrogenase accessory sulfurtransferase FdhD n=1 Tax=Albidovulum sp. TaxID=1872424 RepID=UPI0039B97DD3